MADMLRSRKNHRQHTECTYGCCTNGDTNKEYRVREKRRLRDQIKREVD